MSKYQSIKGRVAAGVKLLDKLCPGWQLTIDVPELDISSPSRCVLGQVFGAYTEGLDYLLRNTPKGGDIVPLTTHFGFALSSHEDGKYPLLTRTWQKAIREALAQKGVGRLVNSTKNG